MSDTFFNASKLVWLALAPSNALALCLLVGVLLQWSKKRRRLGQKLLLAAAAVFGALTILPIGQSAVAHLERRYPPLPVCQDRADAPAIAGIIVLGGALSSVELGGERFTRLGEATDRIRLAADLATEIPTVPVLIAGGLAFPRPGVPSEASLIAALLLDLGVPGERLVIEDSSRNTAENALNVAAVAETTEASWLLVTSAFHMPRAMGSFEAAGLSVIAAPTDWQLDRHAPLVTWSAAEHLRYLDLAAKEYMGLTAYWLTGRTDVWMPKAIAEACY